MRTRSPHGHERRAPSQAILIPWIALIAVVGIAGTAVAFAPTADAGDDQLVHEEEQFGDADVPLDGSGSSDPDGEIEEWRWFNSDGDLISRGSSTSVFLEVGLVYTITLEVTDNDGKTDTDTVDIEVNDRPEPDAGPDQLVHQSSQDSFSEAVTLDGFASVDKDGTIESYVWKDSGGTQIATGGSPTVELAVGQTHTITLEVTDDGANDLDTVTDTSASDTDTVDIDVNELPDPWFGVDAEYLQVGQALTAREASFDSDSDLSATGTWAWDFDGDGVTDDDKQEPDPFTYTSTGTYTVTLTVTDEDGASDSFSREIIVGNVGKLVADDADGGDSFGQAVAVDGDTAVVAAPDAHIGGVSDQGAVYVFTRDASDVWNQVAKLIASDGDSHEELGQDGAVAIDGDTIVVGSPEHDVGDANRQGAAYVYVQNDDGTWPATETVKLLASEGSGGDDFGESVDISGDTIVVGAKDRDDPSDANAEGAVYVFERDADGNWPSTENTILLGSHDGAQRDFGYQVGIDGDSIVASADGSSASSATEQVHVFEPDADGNLVEQATLRPSDHDADEQVSFADAIDVHGDTIVAGAFSDDANGIVSQGAAYVFERNADGTWPTTETQKLTVPTLGMSASFGEDVGIHDDTVIVGAPWEEFGSAHVFIRDADGTWIRTARINQPDPGAWDAFGPFAAIDGTSVLIGADDDDLMSFSGAESDAGSGYIFDVTDNVPVADAGADLVAHVDEATDTATINLDGTASADPDGTLVAHRWATESNSLWTWGDNAHGELGDGSGVDQTSPVLVEDAIVDIGAGGDHSLAVTRDGTLLSWGSNTDGQLGDGTTTDRDVPAPVPGLPDIVSARGGGAHSLALAADGTVWAWGDNVQGQLGDGTTTDRTTPVQVSGLPSIVAVGAGDKHSLAVADDGTVWAWGDNVEGQLGDGTTTDSTTPVQVSDLTNAIDVAGGKLHSLALTADGFAYAWGDNAHGQLGDETFTDSTTPVQVLDDDGASHGPLDDLVAVDAGDFHSMAFSKLVTLSDGTVYTWGDNADGQLGDGTTTDSDLPILIERGITGIAAGSHHSLAIQVGENDDLVVRSWGTNADGELGDGTTVSSTSPVTADTLRSTIELAGGGSHSLAIQAAPGTLATGSTPTIDLLPGEHQLTLQAEDDDDLVGLDTLNVEVNQIPDPSFTVDREYIHTSDATVTVTDGTPPDADGTIDSWEWDFGDGSAPVSGQDPGPHTYSEPGTFTITLTVTDDDGASDAFVREVLVTHVPKLEPSDGSVAGDEWVESIDGDGSTIVLGLPFDDPGATNNGFGSVEIFTENDDGTWTRVQRIAAPDASVEDFGEDVALEGDTLVVGAPGSTVGETGNAGALFVYTRDADGVWGSPQKVTAATPVSHENFGEALAIEGDTLVVGIQGRAGETPDEGAVVILQPDQNGAWTLAQELTAPDPANLDSFGASVALGADGTILAGAPNHDHDGEGGEDATGAVYTFVPSIDQEGTWALSQEFRPSDGIGFDDFGASVDLLGDTALIGAPQDESEEGAAYVFERDGTDTWNQGQKLTDADAGSSDGWEGELGWSVALGQGRLLLGQPGYALEGDTRNGAVLVFEEDASGTWVRETRLVSPEGGLPREVGNDVAILDDTLATVTADDDHTDTEFTGAGYVWNPPNAAIQLPGGDIFAGLPTTFADASIDPDGNVAAWAWDLGDGTIADTKTVTHTYDEVGPRTVTLSVADTHGLADTAIQEIEVLEAPALTANIEADATQLEVGQTLGLAGSAPGAIDGAALEWDLGDGTEAAGANVDHAFDEVGTFTITLTVTDGRGREASVQQTVDVFEEFSQSTTQQEVSPDDEDKEVKVQADESTEISYEAGQDGASVDVQTTTSNDPAGVGDGVPELKVGDDALSGMRYLNVEEGAGHTRDAIERVTISMSYTDAEIDAAGLEEADLAIYYWNGAEWMNTRTDPDGAGDIPGAPGGEPLHVFDAGVDTEANRVFAVVDHTSTYAIGPSAEPIVTAQSGSPSGGGGGGSPSIDVDARGSDGEAVSVTVEPLSEKPVEMPEPTLDGLAPVAWFDVSTSSDLDGALTLEVHVPAGILGDVPPEQGILLHGTEEAWTPLDTHLAAVEDGGATYRVTVDHLSPFLLAQDIEVPLVTVTSPASGTTLETNPPTIAATWSDNRGIDPSSIEVILDGKIVPRTAWSDGLSPDGLSYVHPNLVSQSSHTVVVRVQDVSGWHAEDESTFQPLVEGDAVEEAGEDEPLEQTAAEEESREETGASEDSDVEGESGTLWIVILALFATVVIGAALWTFQRE